MCDVYSTTVHSTTAVDILVCVWYIVLLHSTIAVDVLKYWAKILLPFIPGSQVAVG